MCRVRRDGAAAKIQAAAAGGDHPFSPDSPWEWVSARRRTTPNSGVRSLRNQRCSSGAGGQNVCRWRKRRTAEQKPCEAGRFSSRAVSTTSEAIMEPGRKIPPS